MAKSSKSAKSKIDTSVADAVEVSDESSSAEPVEETELDEAIKDDAIVKDAVEVEEVVTDSSEDSNSFETEQMTESLEAGQVSPASQPEPKSATAGFALLLLGGLAAGAIGYGVATYYPMNGGSASDELAVQIMQQAEEIAALRVQIDGIPELDLSAVETQINDVTTQAAQQLSDLSDDLTSQLSSIDARLLEVEKRPSGDGTLSDTALAAYQRELEELRADLDAQQANVMSAAAQAEADLAAAREQAFQLEQAALAQAEAAAARAALNRLVTAVEAGAPFADALADFEPDDLPDVLTAAAETGVATTAQLTEDFPAAARAALATARAEGVSDDAGGLGGFLRSQFDVRSTTPREGAGPDAVLSRAEAAVKEGRTADALAELEALPEVARAELTDWTARATERVTVLDAIATLSETYN